MVVQLVIIGCMFLLADKYDGTFIWLFFLISGGIVGFDVPHLLQLMNTVKKTK
jgi:hypothetical protein